MVERERGKEGGETVRRGEGADSKGEAGVVGDRQSPETRNHESFVFGL